MQQADISPIEQYVIDRVREKRKEKGYSQRELADLLDLSNGFIASVETVRKRGKYNLNHLNDLAKVFECSPKDFLPNDPI